MKSIAFLMAIVVCLTHNPVFSQGKKMHHSNKSVLVNKDMWADLQGMWQSLDDKGATFIIRDYQQWNFYQKKVTDTLFFNFYNNYKTHISANDTKRKSGSYLIGTTSDKDIYAYRILKLNTELLTLSYLPRGNTLRYKKVYIR